MYFANLCGWDAIKDYRFYQYGPYSEWVSRKLETLVQIEVVRETTDYYGDGQMIYKYNLTENGRILANTISNQIMQPELINRTRKIFNKFGEYSKDELEIMSSLVFLRKTDPAKNDDELVSWVKQNNPRFTEDEIRKNLNVFSLLEETYNV